MLERTRLVALRAGGQHTDHHRRYDWHPRNDHKIEIVASTRPDDASVSPARMTPSPVKGPGGRQPWLTHRESRFFGEATAPFPPPSPREL